MAIKFGWLRTIGKRFIALKENLELRAEEREAKRFSSMDDNPFLIRNRNKRFSTYRSELIHGVMLKPLDKFLSYGFQPSEFSSHITSVSSLEHG